ncbi:MAG: hypothetical protein JW719_09020 [Pirellulales bacterium]|nr:hypothetical protein [Pirellulales bacterium]
MNKTLFAWPVLLVLMLPHSAVCSEVVVQGCGLTITLDEDTGLPIQIDSQRGEGRSWLQEPASWELKNMVAGTVASPGKMQRNQTGFRGAIEPLELVMTHGWTTVGQAVQWHLKFEGDAERVEHRLVIDLPVLKQSDRIFTPSYQGVLDVARHPAYKPPEYAHYDWNGAKGYSLPLVSVFDPTTDNALTVALPACDNIPHLQVEWKDGKTLRLTLARRGMGGGKPSELKLLFFSHAADYRAVLKAYSDLFPRYFNPGLPRGPSEGTFYYHHIHDHPDYEEMARQQVRYLWSSFWFTHLGEYLPEEKEWHPYTYAKGWKLGETMSDKRINAFIEEMRSRGIGVYAYFNVTEYGGHGGKEGNAEEAGRRLRDRFANALMKTADGKNIPTWEGSMAMNPGADYALRPFLREQIRRHIDRTPHIEGFIIDRLDWASGIDYGHSDGLTMMGNRPVENMALPVGDAVSEVCRMAHDAGKRVFVNQFWRVEVLRDADGVCHESDPLPLLGYLTPLRPASAWHQRVPYDGDLLPFEAQMKRRLYWAWFPQMIAHEFPISQQKANPRAADFMEIYAPLFEPLLGKRQILAAHCVSVDGANQANLFVNGAGHMVVPVISHMHFLSRRSESFVPTTVTIRDQKAEKLRWAHVYSSDGPPYRARLKTSPGQAMATLSRHGAASVLVAGADPEPTLSNPNGARIAEIRNQRFPLTTADVKPPLVQNKQPPLPAKIEHHVLTISGEHVGPTDVLRVMVNGKDVGLLRGNQGRFRLPEKHYSAPRVELYAGDEGTWFVPQTIGLAAVCADGKTYQVASWTPNDAHGLDPNSTGRLWLKMSPCSPTE